MWPSPCQKLEKVKNQKRGNNLKKLSPEYLAGLFDGEGCVNFTITDNAITVPLETPSRFPEGTDLAIYTSGEAGAFASCTARGWLEVA